MPLNILTAVWRNSVFFHILSYRIPVPVNEVLLFSSGDSYPICPRCDESINREYMQFCDCCGQRLNWDSYENAAVVHAPRRKHHSKPMLDQYRFMEYEQMALAASDPYKLLASPDPDAPSGGIISVRR